MYTCTILKDTTFSYMYVSFCEEGDGVDGSKRGVPLGTTIQST